MKKYQNIVISLVAYIIAVLSVVFTGRIKTVVYFLFVIIGIIFAFIANRSKESSLPANFLIILGVLGILYPLVAWTGDY
jgi:hypothetical protein